MDETSPNPGLRDQTAVQCYLETILATAKCLVRLCPELGIPYQNRWRRLPQRIGFDPSPQSIERSERMFQSDLDRFSTWAGNYLHDGLRLLRTIGNDWQALDRAIQETEAHVNLLETLANSLDEAADLDASPDVSETLVLQSQGLRKAARQMRSRLLPAVLNLTEMVRECRKVVRQADQDAILDPGTGFLNGRGFRYELQSRFDESQHCCVLLIDCEVTSPNGFRSSDDDFCLIASEFTERLGDQFRPWDCLGRIGPHRFGVIFEADCSVAKDRANTIAHRISGTYSRGIIIAANIEVMEASDAESFHAVLNAIDQVALAA